MLKVENLSIYFQDRGVIQEVVREVSFQLREGEILGIVGESGSGKTMTALAIAGLLKDKAVLGKGSIFFGHTDLLTLSPKEMGQIQGKDINMVFQEPMAALNPTMKIGNQIGEGLLLHTKLSRKERKIRTLKTLEEVELLDAETIYNKYPHELSGGMCQRAMIAAAIVCRPKILIADEPTTALDIGTQDEILELLKKLNKKHSMAILFISHNLKVVKSLCERVIVMKDGEIVEEGLSERVFQEPATAYAKELVRAIPQPVNNSILHKILRAKAGE